MQAAGEIHRSGRLVMVDNWRTRRWPLRICCGCLVGRSVLVHRLLGVLLFEVVGGGAGKTVMRLRPLVIRVYGGGSAMGWWGVTLGVGVAARNVCVSSVLRRIMHVGLTLFYV